MSSIRRLVFVVLSLGLVVAACGGGLLSSDGKAAADCPVSDLDEYATSDTRVRLTMSGPIVAREENRPVRIIVDASYRQLHILEGYGDETIAERMRWENDLAAYQEFLAALEFEGFHQCRQPPGEVDPDGEGACPKNHRMVVELFEINHPAEPVMRLWWADCDRGIGTLAGNARTIEELFEAQIPDFETLTEGVEL